MFQLFPLLPTELRLQIWTFASFIPQDIIAVIYPLVSSSSSIPCTTTGTQPCKLESLTPHFRECTPVTAVLHTCHESRSVALQYYSRVFPDGGGGKEVKGSERVIYFNKSVDTVIIYLPTFRHVVEGLVGKVSKKKRNRGRGVEGDEIQDEVEGAAEREKSGDDRRRRRWSRLEENQNQEQRIEASPLKSPPSASSSSSPWAKGEMMRSFAWRDSFPKEDLDLESHPQKDIFIVIKPFDRKTHLFTNAIQDLHRVGLDHENVSSTWFEGMGEWDVEGGWDRSWQDVFGEMCVQRERGDGWEDVDD